MLNILFNWKRKRKTVIFFNKACNTIIICQVISICSISVSFFVCFLFFYLPALYVSEMHLCVFCLFVTKSFCWTLRLACTDQTVSSSKGTFTLISVLTLNTVHICISSIIRLFFYLYSCDCKILWNKSLELYINCCDYFYVYCTVDPLALPAGLIKFLIRLL